MVTKSESELIILPCYRKGCFGCPALPVRWLALYISFLQGSPRTRLEAAGIHGDDETHEVRGVALSGHILRSMQSMDTVSLRPAIPKTKVLGLRFITRNGPEYNRRRGNGTPSKRTKTWIEIPNAVGMYPEGF